MKDESAFIALSTLLSPKTTFAQADTAWDDLLKKLGAEHAQYDFMKSLPTKCGYFFLSREHIFANAKDVRIYKDFENDKNLVAASLSLLVVSEFFLCHYFEY